MNLLGVGAMDWRGAQVGCVSVIPDRLGLNPPKSALAPRGDITGVLEGAGLEG